MSDHAASRITPTRREFVKGTALAGTALIGGLSLTKAAYAAGDDVIKVGLVGCGGRGTGAAAQALEADTNVKLTAIGDAFSDRAAGCLRELQKTYKDKVDVPAERVFIGFDAYKQVIDSGVDVVLLCSPPHFRPQHLKAAVAAGKHTFCEKPVAVDAPGIRSILDSVAEAEEKKLSIVSGLCYRYDLPKRELMKRVHDGAIGEIQAMHVSYNTGTLWHHGRKEGWSDMEWQLRNWLYFTWLSGDHNVEQHVHSLDKAAWAMQDAPPVRAVGLGGRQVRVEEQFGNIFDHHAVVYEYANGAKLFAFTRQQAGAFTDVNDHLIGTKGSAQVMTHKIDGPQQWSYRGPKPNMYQVEHNELFAAVRAGKPINNGVYMARSSMLAIMGRMATYTGQAITWEQAMNSKEDLTPAKYEWGPLSVPAVAKPGLTSFV